jgi:hypothetical protein
MFPHYVQGASPYGLYPPPVQQGAWQQAVPLNRQRSNPKTSQVRSQSLVNVTKKNIRSMTAGQVLELARFASAQLSAKDPRLYADFLEGLRVKAFPSDSGAHPLAAASFPEPSQDEDLRKQLLAGRKTDWKVLCEDDGSVQYYMRVVREVKAQHGVNAAVDELIVTDEYDYDVKQYHAGRLRREALLTECGLRRDGSKLTLDPAYAAESETPSVVDERDDVGDNSVAALREAISGLMMVINRTEARSRSSEERASRLEKTLKDRGLLEATPEPSLAVKEEGKDEDA